MNERFRKQQSEGGAGGGGAAAAAAAAGASGAAPAWYGAEGNKALVEAKGFKGVDDVFTAYANTEKLIGLDKAGRTIVKPKDDKDLDGIKSFRTALGVPEKADDYGLPVPDGDKGDFQKLASTWLHEAGIPKEAGQKLGAKWNEYVAKTLADGQTALKAEMDKQLDGLKGEWGDKFSEKSEHARRFMKAAGFTDEETKVYEEAFGTASMLKRWSSIGAKLGESGFVAGDGGGSVTVSKSVAQAKVQQLNADRIAGKIDEKTFHSEMDKYGPVAFAA